MTISKYFKYRCFATFLILITINTSAQVTAPDYPHDVPLPKFVDLQANKIEFFGDSTAFIPVFKALTNYLNTGKGQLSVVHFGGSHIQADIYTQEFRLKLNQYFRDIVSSRGLVFPYCMAKTNNPLPYTSKYTGNWESARNVEKNKDFPMGVLGIVAFTNDSVTSFRIYNKHTQPSLHFNVARIFYDADSTGYQIMPDNTTDFASIKDTANGILTINYHSIQDTLSLKIIRTDTDSVHTHFTLYGISLETKHPHLIYHTIGINGASIPSFLRCTYFTSQLKAIHPDLAIMSIGTNDAYRKKFNPMVYYNNLDTLIHKFWEANPHMAIILTVPNDDYYHQLYPNKNTAKQEKVIYDLAKKYHLGVWNLYKIMGGFNSSQKWYQMHLMRRDRIHFTRKGYELKGDLIFSAFLKAWEKFAFTENDSL